MIPATEIDQASARQLVPTIFHEPWWLEAAGNGQCREAVVSSGGVIVGRLPYLPFKKITQQMTLVMPPLTHVLGPALLKETEGSSASRVLKRFSIIRDLIAQLPNASYVWFELHSEITDSLAFEAAGFSCGVNFTMEIAPGTPDTLWRQMQSKTRNVVRRAQEQLTVTDECSPRQFFDFYDANIRERGLKNSLDRTICEAIISECLQRKAGRLLVATGPTGIWKSCIFTVWDHKREYYLMSTRSGDSTNGAGSLLIWTAIQHAASQGLTFDMDGIHAQSNLRFIAGFGGTLVPRYFAWRTSTAFLIARAARDLLTARSFRKGHSGRSLEPSRG